ncbi:hypothetical protein RB653_005251 [Dictyostelium firmibasis]|uniref:Condensin-2 complex subunit H2 n=1 Tax=Dictyostelium firmibasis TaxID=79012 RepID=A0AAN7UKQ3_9MYCE
MEVAATKDYSYLIQPIRDLAENWQIDISKELEDYLSDLDKISFTFEGTNQIKTLNFAEAALLIQGSAVIYSKKVEYLYSLLYQTLDLLAQKKKRKDATSINSEGVDRDIENEDDVEFLALDDILIEDDNIDLNDVEEEDGDGEGGGIRKRMKSNKRKETEEEQTSNESTYKIALMNNSGSTIDRNLMMDLDDGYNEMDEKDIHSFQSHSNELNGKKSDLKRSDFRMNDAIVSKNGAMVLRGLDFLDNENFLSINKPLNFHKNQYTDDSDDLTNRGGGGDFFKKFNEKSDSLLPPNGEHPLQPSSNINGNGNKDDGSGFENAGIGQDSSDDENNDHDDDNDGIGMRHDDDDGTNRPPPTTTTTSEGNGINNNLSPSSTKVNDKKEKLNKKQQQQAQPTSKDAWALLNPFDEDIKNNNRPFKKGKTFNIPFSLLDSDKKKKLKKEKSSIDSIKVDKSLEKILSFSTEPIVTYPNESLSLRGSFHKELAYLYNKNIQQNKQLLRKQRLANRGNQQVDYDNDGDDEEGENNNEEQFFTQENNNNDNQDGIGMRWDDDDDYGDLGGGGDYSDYEGDNMNNNIEHHDGPFQNGGGQYNFSNLDGAEEIKERFISENGIDIELSKPTQTYEELCRSYVEKYLESASKYVRETALSQRVNDWNNRLTPILIEQDSHPTFDIHVYGHKFLNGMKPLATIKKLKDEKDQPRIEISDDENDNDDDCIIINKEAMVPFGELTKNSPVYEVCRMFTSCLQLANNGNIEIISNNKQIDSLNFHLLSLNERHDIQGMQVPSKLGKNILDDDDDDDNNNNNNNDDNLSNKIKNDKKSNVKLTKSTKKKSSSLTSTSTSTSTKRNTKRQKKDESEEEEESEEESESEQHLESSEEEESEEDSENIPSEDEKIKKKQKIISTSKPKPKSKSK